MGGWTTEPTPEELLDLAREAASSAGGHLLAGWAGLAPDDVRAKSSRTDLVTRLDLEAEALIRRVLAAARPGDAILGEEQGEVAGADVGSAVRWIVDPLDGSVNYVYGLPAWAVSVAAEVQGEVVAAVVAVPPLGRTYWATRGAGAFRDGRPIGVSRCTELGLALVATGFAYDREVRSSQAAAAAYVLASVRDVRRLGAAAVDLCLLAEGSVDAYYERGINPWDYAAGALIAAEAGADVVVAGGLVRGCAPALTPDFGRLLASAGA